MMLKPVLKHLALPVFVGSGIPRLSHQVLFPQKLTIVTYHAVIRFPLKIYDWCFLDEGSFRKQMIYLKKHFNVISLSTAIEALRLGKIDRPTAVITFDDGYQNNHSVAFPVLRELSLPATVFLTTAFIDTADTFWNLRLNLSLTDTKKSSLSWNGSILDLGSMKLRAKANVAIKRSLKDLSQQDRVIRLNEIIKALGVDPNKPIESHSPFRMLSAKSIEEMSQSGLIEFGAHSHTHPSLARLSAEKCREEIELSVKGVQELTGHACKLFAYPYGTQDDYNIESIKVLRELGICAAVTTVRGLNDTTASALELRRCGAGADESMTDFKLKVHHMLQQFRN